MVVKMLSNFGLEKANSEPEVASYLTGLGIGNI